MKSKVPSLGLSLPLGGMGNKGSGGGGLSLNLGALNN
jgi:hypothetical protein